MAEGKSESVSGHTQDLVCFLTNSRSLTKEEAELVLSGVEEEIKKQGLKDLPEKTLLELVESKLKEYQLSGKVRQSTGSAPEKPLEISENAMRVFRKRYLFKDKEGHVIETPHQMFRRVAHTVAEVDRLLYDKTDISELEEDFFKMMTSFEFTPNSPTLMNAGPRTRPALRLLCAPGRRQPGRNFRSGEIHGADPQVRRRDRFQFFAAPAQERCRALHQGRGLRPDFVHEGF